MLRTERLFFIPRCGYDERMDGTCIIGAGPAGLAAAMELSRAGKPFSVFEKSDRVGGLAKTYSFTEPDGLTFRTDNGPHRFFSKNPYLYGFIEGLIKENWIEVKRQTRQYIAGKFYDYPINPAQALANIGPKKAVRMVADYAAAQIRYGLLKKPVRHFEDHVVAHFGRTLAEFNMINYTEKIWGVKADTIHTDWATQRIKGLSVGFLMKAAADRALGSFRTKSLRTLVDSFYYPEYGTGLIYETVAARLAEAGTPVACNGFPVRVRHNGRRITGLTLSVNGALRDIVPDNLVESVPPREFLKLLDPAPPAEITAAAEKMRYRDQTYLFITLDKERVTHDQWIYFPETAVPFGRISEMKNFSPKMSPHGKTSLFIEFFCFENDAIWNATKEELLLKAMEHLEPLGFCKRSEVRQSYLVRQKKVYPIYDTGYKEYVDKVKGYLDRFENLYYIGRPGRFRYNNQDHSLEMGIMAARSVITGVRQDIDAVGGESEYFEKGNHGTA